ncbi:MAG: nitroreductase family protein [Schwartzia sp.]|nr:nitroreductase family protein [Schwartzia sp. (in: firmicutes)]
MEFSEILARRHATRQFAHQQVRKEELREIIREARRAPSWMNAQEGTVYIAVGDTAKAIRREYEERAANPVPRGWFLESKKEK